MNDGRLVCVTGAAGFLGTHVVEALSRNGYRVRATVRDASDTTKTRHLQGLGGVELTSADLTRDGDFDAAFEGCHAVFHLASSVRLRARDPQREIVDVSVEGTRRVLEAARRARVKRVILTSSIAAVADDRAPSDRAFSEDDWNDGATVEESPYALSKVQSERLAWRLVEGWPEGDRPELVAMLPGFVLGPVPAKAHLRSSPAIVMRLLRGDFPLAPRLSFALVDARDVALAHLCALEAERPSRRYLCVSDTAWLLDVARTLRERYPSRRLPRWTMPDALVHLIARFDRQLSPAYLRHNLGVSRRFDASRTTRELGVDFRPPTDSILDAAETIVANGWA